MLSSISPTCRPDGRRAAYPIAASCGVCAAIFRSKQSGNQCKKHAVPGSGVCRFHGGLTPKGTALPHFKAGKYSKLLPARLRERYEQAASDPELLSCRHELAVLDARIADVMQRVDTGEAGEHWLKAKTSFNAFREAMAASDRDAMSRAIKNLDAALSHGYSDWIAWRELINLLGNREKLAASERKRILEAKQFVTMEQHSVLMQAVYTAIREEISDPAALAAIGKNLARLLNRPEPKSAEVVD